MATLTVTLDNDEQIAFVKQAIESMYDMFKDDLILQEVDKLTYVSRKEGDTRALTRENYEAIQEAFSKAVAQALNARAVLDKFGITPW